ncbi:MAG: glycosyltransferase family 4 protein [Desulfobacterales bacterium]|jgi:glycosyltransferase involved in cell wall biosynthesis
MKKKSNVCNPDMKVLHLLSNWKWTERSEPAADLAIAQSKLGADIRFICGRSPIPSAEDVAFHANLKGLESVDVLELPKHFQIRSAWRDFRKLRNIVRDFGPDIIHCHLVNAHLLAYLARGLSPLPLIIRSSYDPEGPATNLKAKFLHRYGTDGLVVINQKAKDCAVKNLGFASDAIQVAEPGIDLHRFSPNRELTANRKSFGLAEGSFVVGVVSRIRESRRIDIALAAVKALADKYPQLQMLLVGRGREGAVESVVANPVREMGIANRVILSGYCRGDRLVAAYRAMDVLIYPIPGTDKSCRTVREAMAAGTPVIAPRIGFLTELIDDGYNGRFMEFSAESAAHILSELITDADQLDQLKQNALQTSIKRFSRSHHGKKVLSFYKRRMRGEFNIED